MEGGRQVQKDGSARPQKAELGLTWIPVMNGFRKGFTLLEIVFASAVLVVALSVLIHSFLAAATAAKMSDLQYEYMHKARRQMELLLTHSYADADLSYGRHTVTNGGGFYQIGTNSTYADSIKDIAVSMAWTNPAAVASTVTLYGAISSELHP